MMGGRGGSGSTPALHASFLHRPTIRSEHHCITLLSIIQFYCSHPSPPPPHYLSLPFFFPLSPIPSSPLPLFPLLPLRNTTSAESLLHTKYYNFILAFCAHLASTSKHQYNYHTYLGSTHTPALVMHQGEIKGTFQVAVFRPALFYVYNAKLDVLSHYGLLPTTFKCFYKTSSCVYRLG